MSSLDHSDIQPGCPTQGGPLYPLSAVTTRHIKAGKFCYFVELNATKTYRIAAEGPVVVWQQSPRGWHKLETLHGEAFSLQIAKQGLIAIGGASEDADIFITSAAGPMLKVESFLGPGLGRVEPFPGNQLFVVVDIWGALSQQPLPIGKPGASISHIDNLTEEDVVKLPTSLCDPDIYQKLEIEGDLRHVFRIELPETLPPGTYILELEWGEELVSDPVQIEITKPNSIELRDRFGEQFIEQAKELIGPSASVIACFNPLPANSLLYEGLSHKQIADIPEGNWLLFFGFDTRSLFEQDKALWWLVNEETEEIIYHESTAWPDVYVADSDIDDDNSEVYAAAIAPHFGLLQNRQNNYFNVGPLFQQAPEPVKPPRKRAVEKPEGFLREKGDCPKIRKIAILVQFDDNTSPTNKKGKLIPNFDKVLEAEKKIVEGLGCKPIVELKPDDFITHSSSGVPKFETPRKANKDYKSLNPLFEAISAQFKEQKDCCFELLIFINGHQDRDNYLIYSNKGVPYEKKDKKKDVKSVISLPILMLMLARHISELSKAMKPECIPAAELIVHSCFSGRFADLKIDKAVKLGMSITASSSGDETTKGEPGRYYFLEALAHCIEKNPGKTLTDIFDCVAKETDRRAGGKQKPKRKPPE